MSVPIDRTTDHNTVDVIKTSQSSPAGALNVVPLCTTHSQLILFAEKEKRRRSRDNKRYRDRVMISKNDSVADRNKKSKKKEDNDITFWDNFGEDNVFTLLAEEITRISTFSPIERIAQSKHNFRWIRDIENNHKYILQFLIRDSVFFDLLYCAKSTLPNAGYGLFAATHLPKGMPVSLYLGRTVKNNDPKRAYTMQLNHKYVVSKNGTGKWEKVRKHRPHLIIDGLSQDNFKNWTVNREFYMGAQLLNDLNFHNTGNPIACNCVVQPMLEIVTKQCITKNTELFINYNR